MAILTDLFLNLINQNIYPNNNREIDAQKLLNVLHRIYELFGQVNGEFASAMSVNDLRADISGQINLVMITDATKYGMFIRVPSAGRTDDGGVTCIKDAFGSEFIRVQDPYGGLTTAVSNALNLKVDKTTTVAGKALSSNVTLVKGDVGLGNVDNTSDLNKPVSTAAAAVHATLSSSINTKEPALAAGTTSQYYRGDKTWQTFPTIPTQTNQLLNNSGFITSSSIANLTNKTGNISMWNNDAGYLTVANVSSSLTAPQYNSPISASIVLSGSILRKDNTLFNVLDRYTSEYTTYTKVTTWYDGTTMSDAKCDGILYAKQGTEYFKRVFTGMVDARWFGVNTSNSDNSAQLKAALIGAYRAKTTLGIPGGDYNVTNPISIIATDVPDENGISVEGIGSYRTVKLNYTGTGYCLSIIGSGDEGTDPITRFTLKNITVNGGNNVTSAGGIYIERAYILRLEDCSSVSWAGTNAHAAEFRNVFNLEVSGGNYSNGFPIGTGGSVIVVGSKNSTPWNTSNVQFRNTAIQRGGVVGLEILHDGNIFDNLTVDNVTFGSNISGSIRCYNSNVNNITVKNSHFEGAGYNGTSLPYDATHIDIDQSSNVVISNNEFKDAKTHIKLHRVNSFEIAPNKIYETGNYTISSSIGISITGTSSNYSIGSIDHQNIYSNQIDTAYVVDQYSRVDFPNDYVTETQWNAKYSPNPDVYKNAIITRPDVKAGNVDAAFQSKWTSPDGTNWYRLQLNERGVGWAAAMPTSGSYTQGDVVLNRNPTISGTSGNRYVVVGWSRITTGTGHVLNTDWVQKRHSIEDLSVTSGTLTMPSASVTGNLDIGGQANISNNLNQLNGSSHLLYNTSDLTNYERLTTAWNSNQINIFAAYGGTGTNRALSLGVGTAAGATSPGRYMLINPAGVAFTFTASSGTNTGYSFIQVYPSTANTSGINNLFDIVPTISQSSTAGYTALRVSTYTTTSGSGAKLLLDVGTNSAASGSGTHTSYLKVDNTGVTTIGGTLLPSSNNTITIGQSGTIFNAVFTALVNKGASGNSFNLGVTGGTDVYLRSQPTTHNVVVQQAGAAPAETNYRFTVDGTGATSGSLLVTNGISQFNGTVRANQFRLSALNTAPSSATDTGTLGEIRVDANYIYVCTATNTWVRSALTTW